MSHSDIQLTEEDLHLIVEVSRLGVASMRQIAFATGNFDGDLHSRVKALMDAKAISQFGTKAALGEDSYCATAEGLVSAYLHEVFLKSKRAVEGKHPIKMRGMRLRQRNVTKE